MHILQEDAEYVSLEEIGTHTLRKTFGYHFYKQTKDAVMLQTISNHFNPDITLKSLVSIRTASIKQRRNLG